MVSVGVVVVGLESCARASISARKTCMSMRVRSHRRESTRTEVSRRPGSPNLERHEISSRPSGMTAPGRCVIGKVDGFVGERM